MRALVACLAVLVLAACVQQSDPAAEATYEPVPDAQLERQVAAVPGLARGQVRYQQGFGKTGYYGTLHAEPGVEAGDVLDRVLAILWQGRPEGSTFGTVSVVPADGGPKLNSVLVGLKDRADFEARYGSRPGTGEPPADAPPLRLQD